MKPGDKVRYCDPYSHDESGDLTVIAVDYPHMGHVCVQNAAGERWLQHPDAFEVIE